MLIVNVFLVASQRPIFKLKFVRAVYINRGTYLKLVTTDYNVAKTLSLFFFSICVRLKNKDIFCNQNRNNNFMFRKFYIS